MKGLIGRKLGMTQMFTERGEVIPVTLIQAGPCYVTQVKTKANDGYSAVQVGFESVPNRKLTGGQKGHLKASGGNSLRYLREFRIKDNESYELGQELTVGQFAPGEKVDISGVTKGRGFAGAMKRHGFHGGSITHGQSDRQRAVGSIGAGTTPGRVMKGMKGPGHMGNRNLTISALEVVFVDEERGLIGVRGGVPGANNGLVVVRAARKQ